MYFLYVSYANEHTRVTWPNKDYFLIFKNVFFWKMKSWIFKFYSKKSPPNFFRKKVFAPLNDVGWQSLPSSCLIASEPNLGFKNVLLKKVFARFFPRKISYAPTHSFRPESNSWISDFFKLPFSLRIQKTKNAKHFIIPTKWIE